MNVHSSDGMAEDLIRSIVQMGCAEVHAKTLYEKAVSEFENGSIDTDDTELLQKKTAHIAELQEDITRYAEIRRKAMLYLYEKYKGDKSYWCEIKHLGIAAYTLFEAYEAEEDPALLDLAYDAQKAFTRALCGFLGVEITDCASCFGEMMKGKK